MGRLRAGTQTRKPELPEGVPNGAPEEPKGPWDPVQALKELGVIVYGQKILPLTRSAAETLDDGAYDPIRRMARNRALNVVLEPGARIPAWLARPTFALQRMHVWGLGSLASEGLSLGLSPTTRYTSLRDQFNDISPQGERIFDASRRMAESYADALELDSDDADLVALTRSGLADTLSDTLSARLTLLKCLEVALRKIADDGGAVLVVLAPNSDFPAIWPSLSPLFNGREVYATPSKNVPNRKGFWRRHLEWGQSLHDGEGDGAQVADGNASIELDEIGSLLDSSVAQLVDQLKGAAGTGGSVLVLHAIPGKVYDSALVGLGRALAEGQAAGEIGRPVFLSGSLSQVSPVMDQIAKTTENRIVGLSFATVALACHQASRALTEAGELSAAGVDVDPALLSQYAAGRSEIESLVTYIVDQAVREKLPALLCAIGAGRGIGASSRFSNTLVMTSRHWMLRSVSRAIMRASKGRIPVTDIQCLNILPHPKYIAPVADRVTVIDSHQRDIHKDYLGISPDRIHTIGSFETDRLLSEASLRDGQACRTEIGVTGERPVVTLISQLQPLEVMGRLVASMAEVCADADAALLLRFHPREDEARQDALMAFARDAVPGRNLTLVGSQGGDSLIPLLASDVCVTLYSNMARDAAVLGIPVVAANLDGLSLPLDLVGMGMAVGATTPDELRARVLEALARDSSQPTPFIQDNPHMLSPGMPQALLDMVRSKELTRAHMGVVPDQPDALWGFKRLALVLDRMDAALLPVLFREDQDILVLSEREPVRKGLLPRNATYLDTRYSAQEEANYARATALGEALAWSCVDSIIERSGTVRPELRTAMEAVRQSLWLRIRPTFLQLSLNFTTFEKAVGFEPEAVIVDGTNPHLAADMRKRLPAHVRVFRLDASHTLEVVEGDADIEEAVSASGLRDKDAALLSDWYDDFAEAHSGAGSFSSKQFPKAPRVLVTSDWKLKTVSPTLSPIVRHLENERLNWAVANRYKTAPADIIRDTDAGNSAKSMRIFEPGDIVQSHRALSGTKVRRIAETWSAGAMEWAREHAYPEYVAQGIPKVMGLVMRRLLPELFAWRAYCEAFLDDPRSASVACPGRQWHANLAHEVAEGKERLAMTIQNAYIARGYTFTAPTGNFITAIDQWSAREYSQSMGISPDRIAVTSTPRFDYLSEISTGNRQDVRGRLGLHLDGDVVLFASQKGLDVENEAVTLAFAELAQRSERPFTGIVKLHPRDSAQTQARLQEMADTAGGGGNVKVTRDGDVGEWLLACDAVVTVFSNVGIEAAIVGRPLVIAKFDATPLPVPLDEFDIGLVRASGPAVGAALRELLDDPEARKAIDDKQEAFRRANPMMVEGGATEYLANVVRKAIGGKTSPRPSPEIASIVQTD